MSSDIFRDRTEGTAAKRQELLRRRRDELVTMPHAVRRVVVARAARIAASMAITLGGVALIGVAYSPSLAARVAGAMPGIQPAPLSTLLSGTWLLGLVAWAVSRARVEHRFAVAMSRYVLPSEDLDRDVERLDHEHPDDIARTMGHQLEVKSAAWPIFAASVLLPATALWAVQLIRTHAWPVMSEFEVSLAHHAKALALIGFAGLFGAIAMTRKAARQPVMATLALPLGALAAGATWIGFVKSSGLTWIACGVAVLAVTVGVIARKLRQERALLEVDDPAAGSELFTIRGALREIRAGFETVRAVVRRVPLKYRLFGAIVALGGCAFGAVHYWHRYAKASQLEQLALAHNPTTHLASQEVLVPSPLPTESSSVAPKFTFERVDGRFRVEATLDEHGAATIPMVGFATLPASWRASVTVTLMTSGTIGLLDPMTNELRNLAADSPVTLEFDACKGSKPLALHVEQPGSESGRVALWVSPVLRVAHCP